MPFIRYRLGDRVELIRRNGALLIKVLEGPKTAYCSMALL